MSTISKLQRFWKFTESNLFSFILNFETLRFLKMLDTVGYKVTGLQSWKYPPNFNTEQYVKPLKYFLLKIVTKFLVLLNYLFSHIYVAIQSAWRAGVCGLKSWPGHTKMVLGASLLNAWH